MKLAEIAVNDLGLVAEHNCPCPTCGVNHAVYQLNAAVFMPCWECQKAGWHTLRVPRWARRFVPEGWMPGYQNKRRQP